ncbi:hypothetical protein MNEG_10464 [Monoraphidium neglectum]|uniref:Uncharacterized protein n=1 Tax=Monoraphidium neglectum TaxID=145388 RepID=A0A0D2JCV8_9CHLO|nr:hypothetical protein MNEG_10464 [Monoraphidium neglectum]KIY97497.1 hypothetical protein MNEG_10464 [Monoraphidium neglectum]|eukprot:XP_013896517.1 hypothetical protein MNEG_10464 [Monoraphidium neglectum]
MLKLFQAGGAQNTTFAILYIVNVVIWGLAGVGSFFTLGAAIAAYRRGAGPRRDYEARYGPSELATV